MLPSSMRNGLIRPRSRKGIQARSGIQGKLACAHFRGSEVFRREIPEDKNPGLLTHPKQGPFREFARVR